MNDERVTVEMDGGDFELIRCCLSDIIKQHRGDDGSDYGTDGDDSPPPEKPDPPPDDEYTKLILEVYSKVMQILNASGPDNIIVTV